MTTSLSLTNDILDPDCWNELISATLWECLESSQGPSFCMNCVDSLVFYWRCSDGLTRQQSQIFPQIYSSIEHYRRRLCWVTWVPEICLVLEVHLHLFFDLHLSRSELLAKGNGYVSVCEASFLAPSEL